MENFAKLKLRKGIVASNKDQRIMSLLEGGHLAPEEARYLISANNKSDCTLGDVRLLMERCGYKIPTSMNKEVLQ